MAIKPSEVDFSNINEVQNGEGITPEHINYPLKASALAQALATNKPDISNAGLIGKPTVSIDNSSGTPRLKFENLKGATGAKLVSQVLQGQDEDGGNIYKQTFDDGTTATFTAPKGIQGKQGPTGPQGPIGETPTTLFVNGSEYLIKTTYTVSDKGTSGYITFVLEV